MRARNQRPAKQGENERKLPAYVWLTSCFRVAYVPAYGLAYVTSSGKP